VVVAAELPMQTKYAWVVHNGDTSVATKTHNIGARLLETSKELSVGEMLGGLLGPCNSHHTLIHK
jgi:hypothetical protein